MCLQLSRLEGMAKVIFELETPNCLSVHYGGIKLVSVRSGGCRSRERRTSMLYDRWRDIVIVRIKTDPYRRRKIYVVSIDAKWTCNGGKDITRDRRSLGRGGNFRYKQAKFIRL